MENIGKKQHKAIQGINNRRLIAHGKIKETKARTGATPAKIRRTLTQNETRRLRGKRRQEPPG
eukprot:10048302-Ditylum_brightwellii.AAC.1